VDGGRDGDQALFAARQECDGGATYGQGPCCGFTDAAGSSGDDGDAT